MDIHVTTSKEPNTLIDISVEFSQSEITFLETSIGTVVKLGDWGLIGDLGGPALPGKTLWVALPIGMRATELSLHVSRWINISTTPVHPIPLQPHKIETPSRPNTDQQTRVDSVTKTLPRQPRHSQPNEEIYARFQKSTPPTVRLLETRFMGSIPVALVEVTPIRWARSGHLELASRIRIQLSLEETGSGLDIEINTDKKSPLNCIQANRLLDLVKATVINPDDITPAAVNIQNNMQRDYGEDDNESADLMILTDNLNWDPTFATPLEPVKGDMVTEFERLANHKRSSGLKTKVIRVRDVVSRQYGDFGAITVGLMTHNNYYVTAVGGGGRTNDALHTNVTGIYSHERFELASLGGDKYAIKTYSGNYITTVDGGGPGREIHTDALAIGPWETFTMVSNSQGGVSFKTYAGYFLTAVDGGGKSKNAIRADAKTISQNEIFKLAYGPYGMLTNTGNYVTAIGGGGRSENVIQTTVTSLGNEEKFFLIGLGLNKYALRTHRGYFLTAVGGGGRSPNTIQTDATTVGEWERFTLIKFQSGWALRTKSGNYVTAVGGGSKKSDVIHTNAVTIGVGELFIFFPVGPNKYAIRTADGHFLTAVGGGGQKEGAIHTDQTQIGVHEIFTLVQLEGGQIALKTSNGNYVSAIDGGGRNSDVFHTDASWIGPHETFKLKLQTSGRYSLCCSNGQYVQFCDGGGRSQEVARTDLTHVGEYESFSLIPSGIDDLLSILRKFIRWSHENWGLSYLLLGGDIPVLPIRSVQGRGPAGSPCNIPTDFYYSNLYIWVGGGISRIPYEWTNDQSIYYHADVSVGRAPVNSGTEAATFVSKVIAYEKRMKPDGTPLSPQWSRRVLYTASSWGRDREGWDKQIDIFPDSKNPPESGKFYHQKGTTRALVQLSAVPTGGQNLLLQTTNSDRQSVPYRLNAESVGNGWTYIMAGTQTQKVIVPSPMPTQWLAVYSGASGLDSTKWLTLDPVSREGSTDDQEILRKITTQMMPKWNIVSRLYCDEVDLTHEETIAAEVNHISANALITKLNLGQHIVSLSGHGNFEGVLYEEDPAIQGIGCYLTRDLAKRLSNGFMGSIFFADSCETNRYILDSISKELMRNPNGGAVAYVGYMGDMVTGVGKFFERKFFIGLAICNTIGIAYDLRVSMFGSEITADESRYHILMLGLLGDPSLRIMK